MADPQWSGLPGDIEGGNGGGEVVLVDPRVVMLAEQGEIHQRGRSAVRPMYDVMGVAPQWWPSASWVGTALVSCPQRGEQAWGDQSFGSSDVQGLSFAT